MTGNSDDLNKKNAEKLYEAAIMLIETGNLDMALQKLQESLKLTPEDSDIYQAMAICYYLLGKTELAIKAYQKALKIDPDYLPGYLYLASSYVALNKEDEAADILFDGIDKGRELLKQSPDNSELLKNLASLYLRLEAVDEAARLLYRVIYDDPEDFEALQMLGDTLYEAELFPEAINICKKAMSLNPDDSSVHLYTGLSYQKMNLLPKAIESLTTSLELRPEQPELEELVSHLKNVREEQGPTIEELIYNAAEEPREKGVIRWFSAEKGIGFVTGPDKDEIFLHYTAVSTEEFPLLAEGVEVDYSRVETAKGALAAHLRFITGTPEAVSGRIKEFDFDSASGLIVLEDGTEATFSLFGLADPLSNFNIGDTVWCHTVDTSDGTVAMNVMGDSALSGDKRVKGQVKWFDEKIRNGVIVTDEGMELLLQASAVPENITIKQGLKISFQIDHAESLDGALIPRAVDIRLS